MPPPKKPSKKKHSSIGRRSKNSKPKIALRQRKPLSSTTSRSPAEKKRHSIANSAMAKSSLEIMARSRGIAFGGLSKNQLIRKING